MQVGRSSAGEGHQSIWAGAVLSKSSINAEKVNKAGYTATEVACGWAGAIFEVTRPFWQEQ